MKPHLPVRLFKSVLACLSAVAVGLTLCSASSRAEDASAPTSPDEEDRLLYPAALSLSPAPVNFSAYTPPTKITIPDGYTEVWVDVAADITQYRGSSGKYAFRLTKDITIEDRTSPLTISSNRAWYFTSDSVDHLVSLTFRGNSDSASYAYPYAFGGAIDGASSTITLCSMGSVTFSRNSASSSPSSSSSFCGAYGGAIYGASNTITLNNNNSVTFSGNSASSSTAIGGAIDGSMITLNDNESVIFSGNLASSTSASASAVARGGAIECITITLSNNGSVTFSGNLASSSSSSYAYGGAIWGGTITLSGNESVTFSGNSASSSSSSAYGGALWGSTITLNDNGSVTFSGNSVRSSTSAEGGAIHVNPNIHIRNNAATLFEKNAEIVSGRYRLRSIYSGGDVYLSVSKGKTIEFRDSVCFATPHHVSLNEDYIDAEGKIHQQRGEIIFTGKYTEQHLNEWLKKDKVGRSATAEEITNSRTSDIRGPVTLHGGTLRIEDKAVLKSWGIDVHPGATVSLKDAVLSHAGYALTMSNASTLRWQGANTISANIMLSEGSRLDCVLSSTNETQPLASLISSSFNMIGAITINITAAEKLTDGTWYKLMSGISKPISWNDSAITLILPGGCNATTSVLKWQGQTLSFYYDELNRLWTNATGNRRWDTASLNWKENGNKTKYANGSSITFGNTGAGTISLIGSLKPYSVTVNNSSGYNYTWQGSGRLTGSMNLTKKGKGRLTLNTANTYSGGSTIYAGSVVAGNAKALGSGAVELLGGTLDMNSKALTNAVVVKGNSTINNATAYRGQLTLEKGTLSGSALNNVGKFTLQSGTVNNVIRGNGVVIKNGTGTVTLSGANTYSGGTSIQNGTVTLGNAGALGRGSVSLVRGTLNLNSKAVTNDITKGSGTATLQNAGSYSGHLTLNGGVLNVKAGAFRAAGVELNGGTLNVSAPASLKDMTPLNIAGILQVNAPTTIKLTSEYAIGSYTLSNMRSFIGDVNDINLQAPEYSAYDYSLTLSGNKLVMNVQGLGSRLYWRGNGTWKEGNGACWYLDNGTKKQAFREGDEVYFNAGGNVTVSGEVSPGYIGVNGTGTLTLNSSASTGGAIIGSTNLKKLGSGTLRILSANPDWKGIIYLQGGRIVSGANNALGSSTVQISNATLDLNGKAASNSITLSGNSGILNGSGYRGNYTQSGNLQSGSRLNIISGKTANLQKGNVGGTISGAGNTVINGAVTLNGGKITTNKLTISGSGKKLTAGANGLVMNKNASDVTLSNGGNLTSAGAITARNLTLSNKATLNAKNSAVRNVTLSGKLQATASTVNMHGNLTAGNLVLNNATLRNNGGSARAVSITNSTSLSNNAKLNIRGYLRSKNLTLSKSSLRQHSSNNGVALTGTLTMNSGSTLTAQGALSAANMKLSGGTINLTSASFSTIKVSGTLTLSSAIDLNLGCKLTTGRNYTLIRFNKTNLTSRNNLAKLLGLTGSGATLTLRSTGIILKVTNAAAWNKYLSANKTAFNKAASVVNAIAPAAEETEVVEIAANTATTVAAEPAYDRSSADMLVQSNWGVVNASRAFTDTLGNRASNSTAFGADKSSAVWLSAMGASSRLSSDGAAAGSDYNLFGAAVGMEQQLTEKSSLGLAIGESYGKVNSFTSARTKQDTLHTALYGQYSAVERSRDAVLLDWSAAYGRTESKWQGTEWEQKSVQLDARATWAHQLTADTTVSGFAGMQYFASASADIAPGIKSGSVQNLRGEIGVGIGHMATVKTRVYGELSFVGDMVRHNPTADMGGVRERGANPGRAGINFSVGGTHALNDRWSVNASYNLELMERANSHSANIGASYKF